MKLFNTLTKKVEEFKPLNPPQVTVYACGPTVYNQAHIGNFRTYILTDLLVRTLKYFNYEVKYVMNITDVGHLVSDADEGEDKMEKGARKEGKTAWEIAAHYTEKFISDSRLLNLLEPDYRPRPTQHIPEQIQMVKSLLEKSFAYQAGDGIYFDTSKVPSYHELAGQDISARKAGARVEVNLEKKHPADFAIWKFSPKNEKRQMEWESPWGVGFPGWHIECSAMSRKYLGDTIDIHTGGVDLIPVHHTNEIAQSEAATGKKPFVRYWMHGQFINVDGEKMSKSKNNFYTLDDIIGRSYSPLALRYLYLTAHYRAYLNFTWPALAQAANSLAGLYQLVSVTQKAALSGTRQTLSPEKLGKSDLFRLKFEDALDDDLNIPQALAVVYETLKNNIPPQDKLELVSNFDRVLGLNLVSEGQKLLTQTDLENQKQLPMGVRKLVIDREELRKQGKFDDADTLRMKLEAMGYLVEDDKDGTSVKRKKNKLTTDFGSNDCFRFNLEGRR